MRVGDRLHRFVSLLVPGSAECRQFGCKQKDPHRECNQQNAGHKRTGEKLDRRRGSRLGTVGLHTYAPEALARDTGVGKLRIGAGVSPGLPYQRTSWSLRQNYGKGVTRKCTSRVNVAISTIAQALTTCSFTASGILTR